MYLLVEHIVNEINAKQLTGLALAGTLATSPLVTSQTPVHHKTVQFQKVESKYKVGDILRGEASTYGWGEPLNPKTADGTPMNGSRQFVAMEVVPLGTVVNVKCPRTGKSADFVVKDFGPAARTGRIIDLTAGAWIRLGLDRYDGVADVEVTIKKLGTGKSYHGHY